MEWFIAVLAILVLGVAAIAAAGGMGEMSRDPVRDVYRQQLPDRPLTAEDLRQARFGVTLRGYSMAQVDDLLDRLGDEIAVRDARIAELTGQVRPTAPPAPGLPESEPSGGSAPAPELGYGSDHARPIQSAQLEATDGTAGLAEPEPIGRRAAGCTQTSEHGRMNTGRIRNVE